MLLSPLAQDHTPMETDAAVLVNEAPADTSNRVAEEDATILQRHAARLQLDKVDGETEQMLSARYARRTRPHRSSMRSTAKPRGTLTRRISVAIAPQPLLPPLNAVIKFVGCRMAAPWGHPVEKTLAVGVTPVSLPEGQECPTP